LPWLVGIGDELSILEGRSRLEAKSPQRKSLRTRIENQISIWLSHGACLGVKWNVMRCSGVAQKCLAGDLGSKHARFALDAELALEAAVSGNETYRVLPITPSTLPVATSNAAI
jgi:hypothetical protein